MNRLLFVAVFQFFIACPVIAGMPPRVIVNDLELEQLAEQSDIVTPIGIALDSQGRLLVVESHTHQREKNYTGPAFDRIRALEDSNDDGRFDRWKNYAEGFRFAMNLATHPDGAVYVVTRSDVHLLRDGDGDGRADQNEKIVRLETMADYPHNGLAGIVVLPERGELYLGLGENSGSAYRLVGSDGSSFTARGGAGKVFRLNLDGGEITPIATGFWNPFSICYHRTTLFAVDNDPHARPPCRLLHVRLGSDFGFRYEYNSSGIHPLQAWDGELPGTLPMVCGTGEAPCAVISHQGALWVTSWGDHRIARYDLISDGDSYRASRQIVVQGTQDFRPTGMTLGSDGSFYFTDWVKRNYPVHGAGRIWRLSFKTNSTTDKISRTKDREIQTTSVWDIAQRDDLSSVSWQAFADPAQRLEHLEALRWQELEDPTELLRQALNDSHPDVRLFAVRWICDDHRDELRDHVSNLLADPELSERDYLCILSAVDWLSQDPEPRNKEVADGLLAREIGKSKQSPKIRALALQLISPDHPDVTLERLEEFIRSPHETLRRAAIWTLTEKTSSDRLRLLAEIVRDDRQDTSLRADAIVGLSADVSGHRTLLKEISGDENQVLAAEAGKILRLAGLAVQPMEQQPPVDNQKAWYKLLAVPGDPESGRRLFFSRVGGRCSTCHQYRGRGGQVGPDLTHLVGRSTRAQVITSILLPSQEIAPRYQPWVLVTDDGKQYSGLRIAQGGDSGIERYYNAKGKIVELNANAIEFRKTGTTSIMPAGLEKIISIADMRDLVAFLTSSP